MNKESLIINCINASNLIYKKGLIKSPFGGNLMKLYESEIDFKRGSNFINTTDNDGSILVSLNENNPYALVSNFAKQNPHEIIPYRRNNIYAYLNKLNEQFDISSGSDDMVMFFESVDSIQNVRYMINEVLRKLESVNTFKLGHNKTYINTKIFQKDLTVFGYNLFDIITVNEFKDRNIHYILYNVNDHTLIVLCDGFIHSYNIKTDELIDAVYSYYDGQYITMEYNEKLAEVNNSLGDLFRSELVTMYIDSQYFGQLDSEFNNIFNDQKHTKILQQYKEQKARNEERKTNNVDNFLLR